MDAHKHCMYCGINIPPKDVFCSQKCQDTYGDQRRRALRAQRIVFLGLGLIFALAVFLNMR